MPVSIEQAINIENIRAFPNRYEVTITKAPSSINNNITLLASKVNFEDSFGFNLEHNDAIQAFMMKGVNRIKGVTITFRETRKLDVMGTFKLWMNSIYDFGSHVFIDDIDPTGSVILVTDDGDTLTMEDAIPKSLAYPSYSWSDSNPIELDVSFSVGKMTWTGPHIV